MDHMKELTELEKSIEVLKSRFKQATTKRTVEDRLMDLERTVSGLVSLHAPLKKNTVAPRKDLKEAIMVKINEGKQSFASIGRELGCTRAYVQVIARDNGIYRSQVYTPEMVEKVRQSLLKTHSGIKTANELGLSVQTVYGIKRKHLKHMKRKRRAVKYTRKVMMETYQRHHNYSKMADELGTFPSTISRVMKDLKLREICPPNHITHH